MNLSTIDRLVRKLEPVDALVEKLCGRLLPHKAAQAGYVCDLLCAGLGQAECYYSQACGVETGSSYECVCGGSVSMGCGC